MTHGPPVARAFERGWTWLVSGWGVGFGIGWGIRCGLKPHGRAVHAIALAGRGRAVGKHMA